MTVTRWQKPVGFGFAPWRLRYALRDDLSQLLQSFESAFGSSGKTPSTVQFPGRGFPAVDVYDNKETVTIKAELPGLKKEEISISLHDGVLTLSGERKRSAEYENGGTSRSERWFGRFERSITLPANVDVKSIPATYADGLLTITLNKAEEAKPKQIKIEFN